MAARTWSLGSGASTVIGGGIDEVSSIGVIQVSALAGATVTVGGSLDGSNFVDLLLMPFGSATGAASATATGAWRFDCAGIPYIKITSTGGTSSGSYHFVQG